MVLENLGEMLDDCVHCGFCLPSCPTYVLWGEEMDSPRGRIHLMSQVAEGKADLDPTVGTHIDRCLGCMACVPACPSGVKYDQLLEATRPEVERHVPRGRSDRMFRALIFALFPHPGRLRAAALLGLIYQRLGMSRLARRLPARLRAMDSLMPAVRVGALARRDPARVAPRGRPRHRVGLLTGCVQRIFFGGVNEATARVLAAEGCEVLMPRRQGCCGALSFHAGRESEAKQFARRLIDAFEPANIDALVVNSAGCGSTLKEYGRLLRDDTVYAERAAAFADRVRDVTELLADLEPAATRHPVPARVAYHDACHLRNAQGIWRQPRQLLGAIPELDVVDIPEAELCCGSAGIYNLVQPDAAEELGRRKAANILATRPDVIATANPGCLLQIRRYLDHDIPLVHPIELVDASIRGVDISRDRS